MTLRDQFAIAIAPAMMQYLFTMQASKGMVQMQFDANGKPIGVSTEVCKKSIDYNEVAAESYMLADALLRVSQSQAQPAGGMGGAELRESFVTPAIPR